MTAVKQPKLPYAHNYLEPHISKETLEFHHGKHHMAYFTKLSDLVKGKADLEKKSCEDLVLSTEGVLYNQAAQVFNHSFYWHSMKANGKAEPNPPTGAIKEAIDKDFGSFEKFQEQFSGVAGGHFGSGWAWLVKNNGKLEIIGTHDAECALKAKPGCVPILTCDVWEHAYYIDYRNARPAYLKAWWNLVNWDFANSQLLKNDFVYDKMN